MTSIFTSGSDKVNAMHMPILGFGCSRLTANYSRKAALKNLETAFDHGISYFDTARLYGYGRAESILGDFIRDKRDKVIVVTKAGLNPREVPGLIGYGVLNMARQGLRIMKPLLQRSNSKGGVGIAAKSMKPDELRLSLERSLKELKTDFVDYLLLHEFSIEDADKPEIIRFCEDVIREGKVKATGVGSASCRHVTSERNLNKVYSLIQHEYDVLHGFYHRNSDEPIRSVYGVFRGTQVFSPLMQNKHFLKQMTELIGHDLSSQKSLHQILLASARLNNPQGVVLFSSSKNDRIHDTVKAWENVSVDGEQVRRMTELMKLAIQKNSRA